ncbi:MAG: hypothetical protein HGB04_10125 [Chlorobiaceae bacterium]|nr:hypothetical protein [Chlorobiaceae bacterium]
MTSRSDNIRPVSTIGLLLTYSCPISCAHCLVNAGPRRKEKMALGSVFGWIDDAAAYRGGAIKSIELTGGEPFYDLRNLALVSDHAQQAGLSVSVETNAGWAGTLEQAILTLNQLPAIGYISFSTGVHHQQFIPIGHINNAIIAAELLGRRYDVTVTTDCEQDDRHLAIRKQLEKVVKPSRIRDVLTYPAGRAVNQDAGFAIRTSREPAGKPCTSPFKPVILPDGRVMACSGPVHQHRKSCPLCLGNLRKESLEAVLDRSANSRLLHLIWTRGPHRLASLLSSSGHDELLPDKYVSGSPCDICNKLLSDKFLVSRLTGLLDEPANRGLSPRPQLRQLNSDEMRRHCRNDDEASFDKAAIILQPES